MENEARTAQDIGHKLRLHQLVARTVNDYLQTLLAINEPIQEFDSNMRFSLVDFITVYPKENIRVSFKDGTEIKA